MAVPTRRGRTTYGDADAPRWIMSDARATSSDPIFTAVDGLVRDGTLDHAQADRVYAAMRSGLPAAATVHCARGRARCRVRDIPAGRYRTGSRPPAPRWVPGSRWARRW